MLVFSSFVFTHKKSIAFIYEAMDFCINKNSHSMLQTLFGSTCVYQYFV